MLGAYYTSASYKCWADLMLGAVLWCARGCRQMQVKGLTLLPVRQISCQRWPCKPLPLRGKDHKTNPSPSEAWTRPQDKPLPIRGLDKTTRQTPPHQRPGQDHKTNPSPQRPGPPQRPGQDHKTNPSPSGALKRPQNKPLPLRGLKKTTKQTPPPQGP